MIWKLAEAGMNVARLNMSHGDHSSHQKVIDLIKEYNAKSPENAIAIMVDTKVSAILSLIVWSEAEDRKKVLLMFLMRSNLPMSLNKRVHLNIFSSCKANQINIKI